MYRFNTAIRETCIVELKKIIVNIVTCSCFMFFLCVLKHIYTNMSLVYQNFVVSFSLYAKGKIMVCSYFSLVGTFEFGYCMSYNGTRECKFMC